MTSLSDRIAELERAAEAGELASRDLAVIRTQVARAEDKLDREGQLRPHPASSESAG